MQPFLAYVMPVSSGRPDQGLPGQPPGIWPPPGYPDQGLPPPGVGVWPGLPARPDQGLPGGWGGGANRPDQGLPGGQPGPSHPIVIPGGGLGDNKPEHPIVLPNPGTPTHPIVIPPQVSGPGGTPSQPIHLPPLIPTHPIAPGGTMPVNYIFVYAPGIGGAWLYIGGKPDQGLPSTPPSAQPKT